MRRFSKKLTYFSLACMTFTGILFSANLRVVAEELENGSEEYFQVDISSEMQESHISYQAHVQNIGWQADVNEGETAGTTGKNLPMEAFKITNLSLGELSGGIEYQAHVQDIGWQKMVSQGQVAGTEGRAKAIEALRIRLTGEVAEKFNVYYRVHSTEFGWLGWVSNGQPAGTSGHAYAAQAIEIMILSKDSGDVPETGQEGYICRQNKGDIFYQAHVQNIGWMPQVCDGAVGGTTGQNKNMEAVSIRLSDSSRGYGDIIGNIAYQVYVGDGWKAEVQGGETAGTTGKNIPIQGIRIRLTEQMEEKYDIYYRVHSAEYGWLGWAKNGEKAGVMGFSCPAQALEIKLFSKDSLDKPEQTERSSISEDNLGAIVYKAHVEDIGWQQPVADGKTAGTVGKNRHLEAITIKLSELMQDSEIYGGVKYQVHVENLGWTEEVRDGAVAGTVGRNLQIEAIRISLTGNAEQKYDVYYRVHSSNYGWLGWAKNGQNAGTSGVALGVEAVEIKIFEKNSPNSPEQTARSFLGEELIGKITYQAHVENEGWQQEVANGEMAGTVGKAESIQALKIRVDSGDGSLTDLYAGGVEYSLHVQDIGWMSWVSNGEMTGTVNQNRRSEAVKIRLTGELQKYADIYYRAHVSEYGWLGWACNGQPAGSTKCAYKLQALEIRIVPKYKSAPGSTKGYYTEKKKRIYQNPSQYYQISTSISLTGGGYTLSYGYEGVKVMQVIRRLGLGSGIGMGGAFYGESVQNAVSNFQRNVGLNPTGNVDLLTWLRLGFNEIQWEQWGAYVSPLKVAEDSGRSEHIEAMISTAYSYLGTAYVIGASGPPGTGIDCSGLVMQGLYAAGLDISPINPVRHAMPGYEYESRNMWASSKFKHVSYNERQRGDLIFYQNSSGVVIHVAIYLGNDMVIEAWPNEVVVWPIRNASRSNIKGVVRPFV